jgi:hypothetical protein
MVGDSTHFDQSLKIGNIIQQKINMDKELELKLVEKYPKILRDYGGDKRDTCMHWGMECGPGWYDLLDNVMGKLQYMSDKFGPQVIADQIKEKYGTLRFYFGVEGKCDKEFYDIASDIVNSAERESAHVCEETGKYGVLHVRGGWYKTLCTEKAEELGFKEIEKKS